MKNYFDALLLSRKRRNAYRSLLYLDDHLLEDIGLTKSDVDMMIGRTSHRSVGRKPSGHE